MAKKFDFGGWATKNDILCSDGRTIRKNAFQHQDGQRVPLVWQHMHNSTSNVLGHAVLENRPEGVYAYCSLNNTESGRDARELVEHGDIEALSIHANELQERNKNVFHGKILELSLVLAGANEGARIDNLVLAHSDGSQTSLDDEALVFGYSPTDKNGRPVPSWIDYDVHEVLSHADEENEDEDEDDDDGEETLQDVFNTMNEKQKNVVYAMLAAVIDGAEDDEDDEEEEEKAPAPAAAAASHSATEKAEEPTTEDNEEDQGGSIMKHNVFDRNDSAELRHSQVLTHDAFSEIVSNALKGNGHLKHALLAHAQTYGIENLDYLFPDARTPGDGTPNFVKRDTEWVSAVLNGTHHSPFARVKTLHADITAEEARAKGYVKGALKTEQVFELLKRVTTPTLVYKKQKLDRQDILDAGNNINIVAWMRQEMRLMINEELARAVMVGDGRSAASPDRINPENIRPIAFESELYMTKKVLEADATPADVVEAVIRSRKDLKGTGKPSMYASPDALVDLLLQKDTLGRRLYETEASLASMLRVDKMVEVPVIEGVVDVEGNELLAIIVNLADYNMGTDKGGELTDMNQFDIDFNQEKYLLETYVSGALTTPYAAVTIWRKPSNP